MSDVVILAVGLTLLGVAAGSFRISKWHMQESDYWSHVALLVRLDLRQDATYRPILDWAKANRPSLIARLRGWRPPDQRMSEDQP